ncbi:MAG TPA: chlorite dismutase family protein [Longimicrobiales bacterium]|nr:chlorite dismutase family protein [Longimicrobiales bacterium]
METRTLQHFSTWTLADDYWALSEEKQRALRGDWVESLGTVAAAAHHYQTFPLESRSDILVWLAVRPEAAHTPATVFDALARAIRPFRRYLRPVDALWGFTRPSAYSQARSRQEIDPFQPRTHPYLVMYPFTKTAEWYLTERETRQTMMNEHIGIGKQYREVTQLLVYSVGLQDQEFVVVYETPDLPQFSQLVADLRQTRARAFTKSDAPLHTALYRRADDLDALWP